MEVIREHLVFTGRVQGVGFRYRASHLAGHYGEAEMQGREEILDQIIQSLKQDSYIRIDWVTRDRMEPKPEERRFSVRY